MRVKYIDPLKISFERMKERLFKPVIAENWFVIGFAAWLANIFDNTVSIRIGKRYNIEDFSMGNVSSFKELIEQIITFLASRIYLVYIIGFAIIIIIGLIIIMLWLSSRGKFIFLYDVIENRAEIKKPWEVYRFLGNSLFLWRLVFGVISFIIGIFCLIPFMYIVFKSYSGGEFSVKFLPLLIILTLLIVILAFLLSLISLYLNDFIVPIMYVYNCDTNEAWRKFLQVFSKEVGWFILYALYIMGLAICVGIGIVIFSLMTCCVGLFLLLIPYINAVVLLPISYTHRWLSVIFLSQFFKEIEERVSAY